jgi:hypothetical protein
VTLDITRRFIPVVTTKGFSMQRRFSILLGTIAICTACRSISGHTRDPECDNPNPFGLARSSMPPRVPNPTISDSVTAIVGTVVDSNTNRGVAGAAVSLIGLDQARRDTTFGRADSSGAFSISVPHGRYRLSAGAVNYHWLRETVEFRAPADTLRFVLTRGVALCDVRATNSRNR